MNKEWECLEECNEDDGEETVWYLMLPNKETVFIECVGKNKYEVQLERCNHYIVKATCKSLESAKRWVTMNML